MPQLFSFEGRIGVKQFWVALVTGLASVLALSTVVGLVIGIGSIILGVDMETQKQAIMAGAALITGYAIYVQLAITVKRCHDQGRSGWWSLLTLVPGVGLVWLVLDLGTQRGKPE